jgi:hypothetical protein
MINWEESELVLHDDIEAVIMEEQMKQWQNLSGDKGLLVANTVMENKWYTALVCIVVRDHGGLDIVYEVGHCCEGSWRIGYCI